MTYSGNHPILRNEGELIVLNLKRLITRDDKDAIEADIFIVTGPESGLFIRDYAITHQVIVRQFERKVPMRVVGRPIYTEARFGRMCWLIDTHGTSKTERNAGLSAYNSHVSGGL